MLVTLELIENTHCCVVSRFVIDVKNLNEINNIINIDFENDIDLDCEYDLDFDAVRSIIDCYNLKNTTPFDCGILRKPVSHDRLPYFVHTGGELCLMLNKKKPFAFFSSYEEISTYNDYVCFHKHVESGDLNRYDFSISTTDNVVVKYTTFCLPDEKWRCYAFELLKKSGLKWGWSPSMEIMVGSLLGYSDEENEIYLESIKIYES